jgi:hypothetical protein
MKKTVEEKIKEYIKAGFFERKPRLTTPEVVAYANTHGAKWRVSSMSRKKNSKPAGFTYYTSGGTREYTGYTVRAEGERYDLFDSTETYRTIGDLIRKLPNYNELSK